MRILLMKDGHTEELLVRIGNNLEIHCRERRKSMETVMLDFDGFMLECRIVRILLMKDGRTEELLVRIGNNLEIHYRERRKQETGRQRVGPCRW